MNSCTPLQNATVAINAIDGGGAAAGLSSGDRCGCVGETNDSLFGYDLF